MRSTNERRMYATAGRSAKTLAAAAKALREFHSACVDNGQPYRADDSRLLLARSAEEYSSWLESAFAKRDGTS